MSTARATLSRSISTTADRRRSPQAAGNTPPTLIAGTQFNGIANTTALVGQPFDLFSPFNLIFTDAQTPVIAAPGPSGFSAVAIVNGAPVALSTVNLQFIFDPTTGVGEFSTLPVLAGGVPVLDPNGHPVLIAAYHRRPDQRAGHGDRPGRTDAHQQLRHQRDAGEYRRTGRQPDSYTAFKGVTMTVLPSGGVLANDTDPNLDPFTGSVVTGPAHGTLAFTRPRTDRSPT